jgi:hypothetical protein
MKTPRYIYRGKRGIKYDHKFYEVHVYEEINTERLMFIDAEECVVVSFKNQFGEEITNQKDSK